MTHPIDYGPPAESPRADLASSLVRIRSDEVSTCLFPAQLGFDTNSTCANV